MLDNKITLIEGKINVDDIFRQIIYKENGGKDDQALYVCNLTDVMRKYYIWCEKMPRVKPFYAVKCNDDDNVLRVLAKLGTGFDCASKVEINKVLQFGVNSDRIIFANPCKPSSHIKHAAASNVSLMTFDSKIELEKIHLIFPEARLVMRIRCEAKKAQIPLGEKFGCDPIHEAPQLLKDAKNLGLTVVGISFHVGSGCLDPPAFREAIYSARKLFNYAMKLGYHMNFLDIGGGFPGNSGPDIGVFADVVNSALNDFFPVSPDDDQIEIISEPGRYFVSSAFTLGAMVHSKNEIRKTDGKVSHVKYYINDGVYGSFNPVISFQEVLKPYILSRYTDNGTNGEAKTSYQNCTIWGISCGGNDKICDKLTLPPITIGDVLVFRNMGSYTIPIASSFNGFPIARVLYFAETDSWKDLYETITD
ncbi:Orn/DAP/Arg decarboxylase 2, N-terminal [Sergentomyia squamirostris]